MIVYPFVNRAGECIQGPYCVISYHHRPSCDCVFCRRERQSLTPIQEVLYGSLFPARQEVEGVRSVSSC